MKTHLKYLYLLIIGIMLIAACANTDKKKENLNTNTELIAPGSKELGTETPSNHALLLKKMENAVKKMNNTKNFNMTFHELYHEDLEELFFFEFGNDMMKNIIKKHGYPTKEEIFRSCPDDEGKWIHEFGTHFFESFTLSTFDEYSRGNKSRELGDFIGVSTETQGFGFGGIYVGIPGCNKEFIKKLFAKLPSTNLDYRSTNPCEDERDDLLVINFDAEYGVPELTIHFDYEDVVREVSFRMHGII